MITDVDYANDIALLASTSTQAKSLLHCLERGAGGIGLHVNIDKTVLPTKWSVSETCEQVHLPEKQYLI